MGPTWGWACPHVSRHGSFRERRHIRRHGLFKLFGEVTDRLGSGRELANILINQLDRCLKFGSAGSGVLENTESTLDLCQDTVRGLHVVQAVLEIGLNVANSVSLGLDRFGDFLKGCCDL